MLQQAARARIIDMTNLKTNLRDGAYVAIGAAALGVQHLSKKRDDVKAGLGGVSSRFEPALKEATAKMSDTISPLKKNVHQLLKISLPQFRHI